MDDDTGFRTAGPSPASPTTADRAPATEASTAPGPPTPAGTRFDDRFDELATLSYRVAYRILGSREDARDITQEALARAYARWPSVRDAAPAWVSRVSTNLALDLVRRRRRRPVGAPHREPDLSVAIVTRAELVEALRRLPRRQRDVVVLRYLADISEREVADLLGCTTGTVKQHASRGLQALRAAWPDLSLDERAPRAPARPPHDPDEAPGASGPDTNPKVEP